MYVTYVMYDLLRYREDWPESGSEASARVTSVPTAVSRDSWTSRRSALVGKWTIGGLSFSSETS